MPQFDRYKNRLVNIEFAAVEDLSHLPYPDRLSLVFVTSGSMRGMLNERPLSIAAPCILCLAEEDELEITEKQNVAAQSFHFQREFLNSVTDSETQRDLRMAPRIRTGLSLFQRDGAHTGVPRITEKAYPLLFEWFFVLGTEVRAQSDERWRCRIKKYLIQILGMLEDLNRSSEQSPVDLVLEYIHTNYFRKIALEDLTKCAHLNRVSLNKMFQERCGTTAMGYLLSHRLKVAGDLLTHTDMNLNDIARATGFEYDTYFIKQFTSKRGLSPTTYRVTSRKLAAFL
ncbi:AraC family transcriptional regulator [Paenibacillus sanfengchensis]|uniref:helix-turn-helix domain-containing protein n=1 Tax=Paenibacillus sanfengchensis TaxID=3119819 RepID=UPI002FE3C0A6